MRLEPAIVSRTLAIADGAEVGGGLVHDHELGIERGGAGDRYRLLLAAREPPHGCVDRRDAQPQTAEQLACLLGHRLLVEQVQAEDAARELAAEENF